MRQRILSGILQTIPTCVRRQANKNAKFDYINYAEKFLGIDRINDLRKALREESGRIVERSKLSLVAGILLFVAYCELLIPSRGVLTRYDSALILVLTLIGIFVWHKLVGKRVLELRRSLKNIHTAFALGVIPALFVLLLAPQGLGTQWQAGGAGGEVQTLTQVVAGLFLVSCFAGITEEVFFRGILVTTLRRIIGNHRFRDFLAIAVPALLFGMFHGFQQGFAAGVALAGIGLGLGTGYIASRESLGGVIIYHIAFDFLSLMVPLFSNR